VKFASFFLEAGLHLLLLITIVFATTRRDLVALEVPDLGAVRTQHTIALFTNNYYTVRRSGTPAWSKAVAVHPEHCKLGWAGIEW
jgi:hypothetical protein